MGVTLVEGRVGKASPVSSKDIVFNPTYLQHPAIASFERTFRDTRDSLEPVLMIHTNPYGETLARTFQFTETAQGVEFMISRWGTVSELESWERQARSSEMGSRWPYHLAETISRVDHIDIEPSGFSVRGFGVENQGPVTVYVNLNDGSVRQNPKIPTYPYPAT